MKCLLLDDDRTVARCFDMTGNSAYLQGDWDVVTNFDEFQDYIYRYGVPDVISFDHDLNDLHYQHAKRFFFQYFEHVRFNDTGYHALRWLLMYIMYNMAQLPTIYFHTLNDYGKEKMQEALKLFTLNYEF